MRTIAPRNAAMSTTAGKGRGVPPEFAGLAALLREFQATEDRGVLAVRLIGLLRAVVDRCLRGVQEADREDIVQAMYIKLHTRPLPPREVLDGGDRPTFAYLWKMATNRYRDLLRRRRRGRVVLVAEPDEVVPVRAAAADDGQLPGSCLEPVIELLEHALETEIGSRRERDREPLRVAFRWVVDVDLHGLGVGQLVEREDGIMPSPDSKEFERARNRVYTARKRCREALAAGIRFLVDAGQVSGAEALAAAYALDLFEARLRGRVAKAGAGRADRKRRLSDHAPAGRSDDGTGEKAEPR
jgi:DNA-directed RNA polymerase specialized sigma24 family protein